jgi:hypothetical protein
LAYPVGGLGRIETQVALCIYCDSQWNKNVYYGYTAVDIAKDAGIDVRSVYAAVSRLRRKGFKVDFIVTDCHGTSEYEGVWGPPEIIYALETLLHKLSGDDT